jgi:IS4 transposase
MELFKNNIIVADRGYFSYAFLNFLIENKLQFIIRVKGKANNLNAKNTSKKLIKNNQPIDNIKKHTRIITYEKVLCKTIYASNSKKKMSKHLLQIKNDCVICTNLLDETIYTDDKIMELYRSRWDIEVFFKYIKTNYKFQHA